MEKTLSKINNIPVRTWRWLGVNNISIEKSLPKVIPYNAQYVSEIEEAGIRISKLSKIYQVNSTSVIMLE